MKHASPKTLASLAPLLKKIRSFPGLKEPRHGTFYRKSNAFLHFHEDPAGIFADYKTAGRWNRLKTDSRIEQAALIKQLKKAAVE